MTSKAAGTFMEVEKEAASTMVAGIGCDPELRLSLSSVSAKPTRVESILKNTAMEKHPMTIFYKGRVCVCQATEFQARAIISMAKREMNDMNKITKKEEEEGEEETSQQQESMDSTLSSSPPPPPQEVSQILHPGLSMKRSLQRFLQKRNARIHNSTPYTQKPELFLFPIELKQA